MKLIRGENLEVRKKLDIQLEIESYRIDMINILNELLNTKDELIGQLRSEIAELKT